MVLVLNIIYKDESGNTLGFDADLLAAKSLGHAVKLAKHFGIINFTATFIQDGIKICGEKILLKEQDLTIGATLPMRNSK